VTEIDPHLASSLSRRFRLVRRLGEGGMGAVYLAEQIAVGNRPVALKVLSRKLLDEPNFIIRFQNEAASTGRIHHPNVVTIYESGQADDGTPYIAMEFLEGESLRQALERRGRLSVPEVVEILQQAARGLNAAHKLGIIHRDLKPDNIFLTYSGDESVARVSPPAQAVTPASPPARVEGAIAPTGALENLAVKIVDFGIAKLRESGPHTQTGMVLGTPAYMSFEQASGMRSDELDARSDVYSLGVVVYEMLTGRTPFQSDTPVGYLRMHMQEDPPPFRAVKPDLPALPQLESVVMKALTKDRNQRHGSVLEFAHEIAKAVAARSEPAARPESQREAAKLQPQATVAPAPKTIVPTAVRDTVALKPLPARHQSSRRKWLIVAGCSVFLVGAAAGGMWYRTRFRWRLELGQVVSHPDITFKSFVIERTLTGNTGSVESVAFSPDGRLLASGGGGNTIKLWDVGSGMLRREIAAHCTASLAFSPDGKLLACADGKFLDSSGGFKSVFYIKLWDVANGTVTQTLTGYDGVVNSVAFSPDGKLLASGNSEGDTLSPDGKLLASAHDTLKLWDVTTGTLRQTLPGHDETYFPLVFSPDGSLLAYANLSTVASPDGKIKIWSASIKLLEVPTGTLMRTLTGHARFVWSIAFSPDGKLLASGSDDKTIKLWDVASGVLRQTVSGHSDGVLSLAFSPDGKLLASASQDKTIKLWDAASGALMQTLTGHNEGVGSVAFSPNGKLLASGSGDKTIKVWRRRQ
jgi:WD40 repeat protein/serine/threonine protein kinase